MGIAPYRNHNCGIHLLPRRNHGILSGQYSLRRFPFSFQTDPSGSLGHLEEVDALLAAREFGRPDEVLIHGRNDPIVSDQSGEDDRPAIHHRGPTGHFPCLIDVMCQQE